MGDSMSSMVLSGDTSGTVTVTVPAVAGTNTVTIPASTGTVLTTSTTGVCQAWCNYNGSTQTIRASYNISSVTRNGAGDYSFNFTNAMTDANYSWSVSGQYASNLMAVNNTAVSSSSIRFITGWTGLQSPTDYTYVTLAIFR